MANNLTQDTPFATSTTPTGPSGYGTPPASSSSASDASASPNGGDAAAAAARGERFERVVNTAHAAVDAAAESVAQAAEVLRDKAHRLGETEQAYAEACRASVREHPLSYLAGAVIVGLLIGRLSR
ncbi:hypothetical protein AACH06_01365 [Ideonella sp. DXS29W]|uniref:DUF883 domain-containing protein n=1 Tax=Ideonella lacteola TaxID=2984193 RepID=A0ABU9BHN0_9BURK